MKDTLYSSASINSRCHMAEITLLRHGQASFGADNYDQLSPTGHQQARWLGAHRKNLNKSFDRIVMGTMVRHLETAQGVMDGLGATLDFETHAGLNEYDFQGLLRPLKALYPDQWLDTGHAKRDYYHNMKLALNCWMDGRIASDGNDTWDSFCNRIQDSFEFIYNGDAKRTLVVSSGGPISVILAHILQLDKQRTLQIKNSSTSTLLYNRKDFALDSFNDVSHLLTADKQNSITFS